eukprot:TRINITY_DN5003_c0_g1_i1.p1 TRINITY_DN5003_c0_g1~~TRINITY_DN5003_c0_g1_i1.p1  ORF type:complete len:721 (+),score=164.80 TRINITY_DN5003_c0_g1_i1:3-2165(+)
MHDFDKLFTLLPVRASSFQSGRMQNKSNGEALQIKFSVPFSCTPRFHAFASNRAGEQFSIPRDSIVISQKGARVVVSDVPSECCAVSWLAYSLPLNDAHFISASNALNLDQNASSQALFGSIQDCVKALGPNATNTTGSTLLHCSADVGNIGAMKLLLELGADINAQDFDGFTPLMTAIAMQHWRAAQFLMESPNCNLTLKNEKMRSLVHILCRSRGNRHSFEDLGEIYGFLTKLLSSVPNAFMNEGDEDGNTPLHHIAMCSIPKNNTPEISSHSHEESIEICQIPMFHVDLGDILLSMNTETNCKNSSGMTPLAIAVQMENFPLSRILIEEGAELGAGGEGKTASEILSKSKNKEFVSNILSVKKIVPSQRRNRMKPIEKPAPISIGYMSAITTVARSPVIGAKIVGEGLRDALKSLVSFRSSKKIDVKSVLEPISEKDFWIVELPSQKSLIQLLAEPEFKSVKESFESFFLNMASPESAKRSPSEEGKFVSNFIESIGDNILQRLKLKRTETDEKNVEKVMDDINFFVFSQIYDQVFKKPALQGKDALFSLQLTFLQSTLTPSDFYIPPKFDLSCVEQAKVALQSMNDEITPTRKLQKIMQSCKIIISSIQKSGAEGSADDFFPLFSYVILRSNISSHCSNIDFIERFLPDNRKSDALFCFFTHLKAASQFIESQAEAEVAKSPLGECTQPASCTTPSLAKDCVATPTESDPLSSKVI